MIDIDWVKGAPDELRAGMIVQYRSGSVMLIGHVDDKLCVDPATYEHWETFMDYIEAWAWLVKPHELEWIEAIGARKP